LHPGTFYERPEVKICLACEHSFTSETWLCPRCAFAPQTQDGFPSFAPELSQSNDGFSAGHFAELHALEAGHFWFRARNKLVQFCFKRYFPRAASFLEIGCGTGFVLSGLHRRFSDVHLAGSEIFTTGLDFARKRLPGIDLFQMDARRLPFEAEYDVIGAFDVLEHIEEDECVLASIFRACRPGGGLMLTVPQHRFLWSVMDDYACHKRRYTRRELVGKVERAGFQVVRTTSFVTLLLPLLVFSRWKRNCHRAAFDPLEEFRIGRLTNATLEKILAFERFLITWGISFPAGGSLLLVAQRRYQQQL
jgi:SAM-dependent methyltransferase